DILDLIWPRLFPKSTCSPKQSSRSRMPSTRATHSRPKRSQKKSTRSRKKFTDLQVRRPMSAIKRGVIDGDSYYARFTTRALLLEVFSKTPDYFQALRYSQCDLRATRDGSHD
ncbi:MAG TPA: hypothetical protein VJX67_02130, partial [Blastocatellia bacterium]|nr:hypothetical protein [Blastocatellia bacterium]